MFSRVIRGISVFLAVIAFNIKYRFHAVGAENIPKEGPVLICANHRKAEDPILIYLAYRKRFIHFYAKQALFKGRFMKWYLEKVCGTRAVSHSGADIGAIKWGVEKLKAGEVVGIFPEGTRNRTDAPLLELQSGTALVAHMSKAKVVTATVNCTHKWFSQCEVVFSEPLDLDELYSKRVDADGKEQIMQKIRENILKSLKK